MAALACLVCCVSGELGAQQPRDESASDVRRNISNTDERPTTGDSGAFTLTYEGQQPLPGPHIGGRAVRVHSQGLYVTEKHYYVTGRLETPPKRALFLRFDRKNPKQAEYIDVTPSVDGQSRQRAEMDHPGGFDFDGSAFWIPVAISKPHSKSIVVKVAHETETLFSQWQAEQVFRVDDHIGAIAVDRHTGQLYGANWDTKIIYAWGTDGKLAKKVPRDRLIHDDADWALAVQDWKSISRDRILAAGLDKNPRRPAFVSRSVIDLVDVGRSALVARVRLPNPPGRDGTATREGMAVFDERLFLLPGDLGRDAVVYRYRINGRLE